jgi:hypothetical protein
LEQNDCGNSGEMGGDVVIVVPAIDSVQMEPVVDSQGSHSHHICIDADTVDIEPNSPKTITESSSKFAFIA